MVFSIFRHLHRTKIVSESVGCCTRKLVRPHSRSLSVVGTHRSFQGHFGKEQKLTRTDEQQQTHQEVLLEDNDVFSETVGAKDRLKAPDYFKVGDLVDLKELFDARVHLGHRRECVHPTARKFVYGQRAGHTIIDLNQTVPLFKEALNVLSHIVYNRGTVCFVSTDPRHDYIIQKAARGSGEYFITRDWYQGQFTNAKNFYKTKSAILPDLVIAFNITRFQKIKEVIREASQCNIPVIGIIDTDSDAAMVTYPVPANDDTPESVAKLCDILGQAIRNAKKKRETDEWSDE